MTKKTTAATLIVSIALLAVPLFAQQQPASTQTPSSDQAREMKVKYAAARAKVQSDPEYQAAVKRADEARRAAEQLFFAKMRRADPSISAYLDRLEGKAPSAPAAKSAP